MSETAKGSTSGWLWLVALAVVAAAAGFWVSTQLQQPGSVRTDDIRATVLQPPKPLPDFTLVDYHGEPFTPARLQGHWSLLFFGYTHCPDVCPGTLALLNDVDRRLAEGASGNGDVKVVFISVDPERDTPEQLAKYVPYFNKAFLGVTGGTEEINLITQRLGILHVRVDDNAGASGYLIDHSASILLIDPAGRLYALFSTPHDPAAIAADLDKIRARYRG
jgi:protein SCO1/2